MRKLRYPNCPRAKVRCQGPLATARAQPLQQIMFSPIETYSGSKVGFSLPYNCIYTHFMHLNRIEAIMYAGCKVYSLQVIRNNQILIVTTKLQDIVAHWSVAIQAASILKKGSVFKRTQNWLRSLLYKWYSVITSPFVVRFRYTMKFHKFHSLQTRKLGQGYKPYRTIAKLMDSKFSATLYREKLVNFGAV